MGHQYSIAGTEIFVFLSRGFSLNCCGIALEYINVDGHRLLSLSDEQNDH